MCTVIGTANYCAHILFHNAYVGGPVTVLCTADDKIFLVTVLCNCALRDDGPVRAETCNSLCIFRHYCDINEVCAFVGLPCNSRVVMHGCAAW